MEGIEPSLNLAADMKIAGLMLDVQSAHKAWMLDRANIETIEAFKSRTHALWAYLISLKTVAEK